jgi:hypothetical protein
VQYIDSESFESFHQGIGLLLHDIIPDFCISRGDIILKTWEANLVESKRLAWEVKKSCEEACSSLDKDSLDIEKYSISESLGQIDIEKNKCDSRTSMEEARD